MRRADTPHAARARASAKSAQLLASPPPPIATHVELRAPHGEMAFCLRRARLTSTRFAPVWAGATFVASVLRMGHFKSKKSKANSSAGSSGAGVLRHLQPQPRHTPVPNADPGQAAQPVSPHPIHPRQVAQVQGQVVGRYKPPPATQLFCSIVAGWRLRPPTPPRPHFRLAVRAERAGGAWLGRTPLVRPTCGTLYSLLEY